MNRASFDTYVERVLAPALRPGQIVVADNLSSHKSLRAIDLLRAQGNDLIFLPPYSPDLNPIEMAFSKLKTLRRENDSLDRFLFLHSPQGRRQNLPGPLETGRGRLRSLPSPGMQKLLQSRRIWSGLRATCSKNTSIAATNSRGFSACSQ